MLLEPAPALNVPCVVVIQPDDLHVSPTQHQIQALATFAREGGAVSLNKGEETFWCKDGTHTPHQLRAYSADSLYLALRSEP